MDLGQFWRPMGRILSRNHQSGVSFSTMPAHLPNHVANSVDLFHAAMTKKKATPHKSKNWDCGSFAEMRNNRKKRCPNSVAAHAD